jgi:hypothetical protein
MNKGLPQSQECEPCQAQVEVVDERACRGEIFEESNGVGSIRAFCVGSHSIQSSGCSAFTARPNDSFTVDDRNL